MHHSRHVSAQQEESTTTPGGEKPSWWRRWIVAPIVGQLKQGISPDKLGWTIGAGVTLGVFPVLGARGWLCLVAGLWFKLNQPVLHTFKSLVYPLHVALIIPFIQFGQWLAGKEPLQLSFGFLRSQLAEDPWGFWREFGWIVLRAAGAWLLVAPFVIVGVKLAVTPLLRRLGRKRNLG